jgi:hypothetical protein
LLLVSVGHLAEGERVSREDAKGFEWGNSKKTSFFFAASRRIPDPISRRWMSNQPSSVLCVGTTRSAHKIGWLTHLREFLGLRPTLILSTFRLGQCPQLRKTGQSPETGFSHKGQNPKKTIFDISTGQLRQ